jgi:hypothetical protein
MPWFHSTETEGRLILRHFRNFRSAISDLRSDAQMVGGLVVCSRGVFFEY